MRKASQEVRPQWLVSMVVSPDASPFLSLAKLAQGTICSMARVDLVKLPRSESVRVNLARSQG